MTNLIKLKLVIILVLAATSIAGLILTTQSNAAGVTFAAETPPINGELKSVYISGAVVNPGAYEITETTTVGEILERAGGVTDNADAAYLNTQLNLAAVVTAGDHIQIPAKQLTPTALPSAETSGKININTASLADLDTLPGIGPSLAANIVAARPFSAISDLKNVKGIGDSKYAQLESLVSL